MCSSICVFERFGWNLKSQALQMTIHLLFSSKTSFQGFSLWTRSLSLASWRSLFSLVLNFLPHFHSAGKDDGVRGSLETCRNSKLDTALTALISVNPILRQKFWPSPLPYSLLIRKVLSPVISSFDTLLSFRCLTADNPYLNVLLWWSIKLYLPLWTLFSSLGAALGLLSSLNTLESWSSVETDWWD